MTSFRRMSLVPETTIKKPEDLRIAKYSELDQKMSDIMNSKMEDAEKLREYHETLSSYLTYHNKLKQPSLPTPPQQPPQIRFNDKLLTPSYPPIADNTTPLTLPQPRIGRMRRNNYRQLISPYSKTINRTLTKVRHNLFSDSDDDEQEDKKAIAKSKFKWISTTR